MAAPDRMLLYHFPDKAAAVITARDMVGAGSICPGPGPGPARRGSIGSTGTVLG